MNEPIDRLWGIPNLQVTARTEFNDRIEIDVETIEQTYHCCLAQRLVKWSPREKRRKINDTHLGGFPVMLNLKVKRAKCHGCGKQGIQEHFDFIQPFNVDEEAMKPLAMANGEYHVCRMSHTAAEWRFSYHRVNAEFIVRACNSHYDLIETLTWVRKNYASGSTIEINARVDAAIAKAEGE